MNPPQKSNVTYNDFATQVAVIGGDDIENGETDFDNLQPDKELHSGLQRLQ